VHLDGGATQLEKIVAGNIDVAFDNVGGTSKRIETGELRGLAVLDEGGAPSAPRSRREARGPGIAIKIMMGEEYAKYFADTHAKAKKYTEWAKKLPVK
jgi:hypothetical protein